MQRVDEVHRTKLARRVIEEMREYARVKKAER